MYLPQEQVYRINGEKETNLTDGGTISGAATATLTINPTVSGDAASITI
jgi:hypothetical protein